MSVQRIKQIDFEGNKLFSIPSKHGVRLGVNIKVWKIGILCKFELFTLNVVNLFYNKSIVLYIVSLS